MKKLAFYGLFAFRRRWTFSPIALVIALLLGITGIAVIINNLYAFLAVTDRVPSNVLVIEGWMPTALLDKAAIEYFRGGYKTIIVVRGYYNTDPQNSEQPQEDYILPILAQCGVPRSCLESVRFPSYQKDKTLSAALALDRWYKKNNIQPISFNLLTTGASSRRSLLLFRKIFHGPVKIGTVAIADPSFDSRRWWFSSQGVREVLFEGIVYFYLLLTFSAVR